MLNKITRLFPIWALLFALIAFFAPNTFVAFKPAIVPLLIIIMLAMGLTLQPKDFANVVANRKAVTVGVILQFTIMPFVALLISLLLGFNSELTVGMILVGSVAGGTSSNVMCYLAKGDVALSITMTAISTLLGVVFTPLLVEFLAGKSVDVPMLGMLMSLVKIVFVPVSLGLLINTIFHKQTAKLEPVLPLVSMVAIIIIIATVVALNASQIVTIGPIVALAVVLHNGSGLFFGYTACRLIGFEEKVCRTVAFEVGLQNSGLATALAMKFFSPASAVAGSLFSVWHNISGSILAGYWSSKKAD